MKPYSVEGDSTNDEFVRVRAKDDDRSSVRDCKVIAIYLPDDGQVAGDIPPQNPPQESGPVGSSVTSYCTNERVSRQSNLSMILTTRSL